MIENLLVGKTAKEKREIKGREIAKINFIPRQRVQFSGGDFEIEILETNAISGGVEIFARAWKPNGGQVGFGKDGSVEIERFRIINPPVLVDDPLGEIVREEIDRQGNIKQRRLREAPADATLQSLAHTIKIVGKDGNNIVKGKRGNTTSTFYPAAGAAEPVDGRVQRGIAQNETWATIHDSTGNGTSVTAAGSQNATYFADDGTNWDAIYRSIFGFTTSSIGSDTVDSATFSVMARGTDGDAHNSSIVLDRKVPAATNNLGNGDYDASGWAGVLQSNTQIDLGVWGTGAYNDYALNATGLGNVNTAGLSWYGIRNSSDFNNIEPTKANGTSDGLIDFADVVGTASDPKLVVTHSASSAIKTINGLAKASVKTVNGLAIASMKTWNGLA